MDLCFKFDILEIKISQEYEPTKHTSLPIVRYACGQLNFKTNCSKKKNEFTHLKTMALNDKMIDIENLDDAAISTKENLKSEGNLLLTLLKIQKANYSLRPNGYTHLKLIHFKDNEKELKNLKLQKGQEIGKLKLEGQFVIITEKSPIGTLFCLYDVTIGEIVIAKQFITFRTRNRQIATNKIE
uniref:DUF7583 domain-containing protein n=1 Tax=Strongyloides venezuelensis TaxID=75913 RepID=A0A0K0FEY7_STRVS